MSKLLIQKPKSKNIFTNKTLLIALLYAFIILLIVSLQGLEFFLFDSYPNIIRLKAHIKSYISFFSNFIIIVQIFLYWKFTNKISPLKIFFIFTLPFLIYIIIASIYFFLDTSLEMYKIIPSDQFDILTSKYPSLTMLFLFFSLIIYSFYYICLSILPLLFTFFFWSMSIQIINKKSAIIYLLLLVFIANICTIPSAIYPNINKYIGLGITMLFAILSLSYYVYLHKKYLISIKDYQEFYTKTKHIGIFNSLKHIIKNKSFWIIIGIILFTQLGYQSFEILLKQNLINHYPTPKKLTDFMYNFSLLKGNFFLSIVILFIIYFAIKKYLNWYKITLYLTIFNIILILSLLLKPFSNMLFYKISALYQGIFVNLVFWLFQILILITSTRLIQTKGLILILCLITPNMQLITTILINIIVITLSSITGSLHTYVASFVVMIFSSICLIFLVKKSRKMLV